MGSESEKYIQETLIEMHGKMTIIAVAHRLSTIRETGCIVYIEDGSIKEMGTNDELIQKSGGLRIVSIQQYQRYPLTNHLHWLSKGEPGGHQKWPFLDSSNLNEAYANSLASIGKCDTLIAWLEKE